MGTYTRRTGDMCVQFEQYCNINNYNTKVCSSKDNDCINWRTLCERPHCYSGGPSVTKGRYLLTQWNMAIYTVGEEVCCDMNGRSE